MYRLESDSTVLFYKYKDLIYLYHQYLIDLVNTGKYESDDFTVVIQPFMAHTKVPIKSDTTNEIDYSYFAPDCFHFSG